MSDAVPDGMLNSPYPVDLRKYADGGTDEAKIKGTDTKPGAWVPCRICEDIFARLTLTARFCATCHRGFCEGQHGNFTGGGRGVCVRCLNRQGMSLEPT